MHHDLLAAVGARQPLDERRVSAPSSSVSSRCWVPRSSAWVSKPPRRHRVRPGSARPPRRSAGDDVELRGERALAAGRRPVPVSSHRRSDAGCRAERRATARCRSAIERAARACSGPSPGSARRAPRTPSPSAPVGSVEPAERQRRRGGRSRRPAAAAAPGRPTPRAAGRRRSRPASGRASRSAPASSGEAVCQIVHRPEVAVVGLRVADAADDRQLPAVPQALEPRQARVQAEPLAEVEHLVRVVRQVGPGVLVRRVAAPGRRC